MRDKAEREREKEKEKVRERERERERENVTHSKCFAKQQRFISTRIDKPRRL